MVWCMHADDHPVSATVARALVADQMPHLAGLPLRRAGVGGTDNVIYRLGTDLVGRFPRLAAAADGLQREMIWLPRLAAHLPVSVPVPVAAGIAGQGHPLGWAVLRWVEGEDAFTAPPADDLAAARALAGFVAALRAVPVPEDAPVMPEGGHLRSRDAFTRTMIARITDEADPAVVTRMWGAALALPVWTGKRVLVHADLHPLNLLTRGGEISAVIDWGAFCAGDPAHDLICGWTVLDTAGRMLFRQLLDVDDATWTRGRALAFSKALMAAPYYRKTNPRLHEVMRATLARATADWPD